MKISDPFIRISTGVNLTPEDKNLAGSTYIGMDFPFKLASPTTPLSARLIFSAPTQTVTFASDTGTLTPSAVGTAQVESATIIAAAGATAAGNLAVTITSARSGVSGTFQVPLTPAAHSENSLIAAAIRKVLTEAFLVNTYFEVGGDSAEITLTSRYAFANDTTLNIAIAGALGVTAVVTSTTTTAGVAGVMIVRPGANGKDIYGGPWVPGFIQGLAAHRPDFIGGAVVSPYLSLLTAASSSAVLLRGGGEDSMTFTCFTAEAMLDIVVLCGN